MDFKEEFLETIEESINDACLMTLTSLALRHIDKENKKQFDEIRSILFKIDSDKPEILKVKEIIQKTEEYDSKMIGYLKEVEVSIVKVLRKNKHGDNSSEKKCKVLKVEEQRKNIKKWWE